MAECMPLKSAALCNVMMTLPGEKCCSAMTAMIAHGIANDPNLPLAWSSLADMLEITSCTADAWGQCTDAPIHVGDADTMKKVLTYLCEQWDAGCNVESMTGTGTAATDIVPPFKAVEKKTMCDGAGPAEAPMPAPEPMGPTAECMPLKSAALGNVMMTLPGEKCCSAMTAMIAHGIANDPNLPLPWSALAGMLEITSCTADAWGQCTEAPIHVGDADTMKKVLTYLCEQWDAGCNVESMTGTGTAAQTIVP